MNAVELNPWPNNYRLSQKKLWTGRATKPEVGIQYWYQAIEIINIHTNILKKSDVSLLGYACDEGVRRNRGRTGAQKGPDAIRQQLAKLSFHHHSKTITDSGNIICEDKNMEAAQDCLAIAIQKLIASNTFPIVLGGGHDISFGHFQGIKKALANHSKQKIGIINFDAHFDLRPFEKKGNSGTPFNQILQKFKSSVEYLVIGIQQQSNTKELFEIAKENKVSHLSNYECDLSNFEDIKNQLSSFINRNDWLYITIDMDAFSSAYAPGVSAPSPMGISPHFLFKTLSFLLNSKKVISLDIAELNPNYDQDHMSANLAASIVDYILNLI